MDIEGFKEVLFDVYCSHCKHKDLEEKFDPCNECLEHGVNQWTHKPVHYEPKDYKSLQ